MAVRRRPIYRIGRPIPQGDRIVQHPALSSANAQRSEGVAFVVYAPFGTDEVLSTYPDGTSRDLAQHPLLGHLLEVSRCGIGVTALVDRVGDETQLIEIPPGDPARLRITSRWKQDMAAAQTLAGLLRHARQSQPGAAVVLALEGHGAGFLPDLDRRQFTAANVGGGGTVQWRIADGVSTPQTTGGAPLLPVGCPTLPVGCPTLPVNHLPLSTFALGAALRAGLDGTKLAAIHFNNCFNMAVEVLHTVAPYAEHATGYMNYNFFTAGQSYPAVFERLRKARIASAEQLAQWFADENRALLAAKGNHPTVGGVVALARLHEIVERIDDLADALLAALRSAPAGARPAVVSKIRHAIVRAQQYDTQGSQELETPDELTDVASLATALLEFDSGAHPVAAAAKALRAALVGIKRYGERDQPWTDPNATWDFTAPDLAMSIFLPDPLQRGLWDWRSPYYLDVNPDPARPRLQHGIIDFVKVTDWVDFIVEYHRDTRFVGLLPAEIPRLPAFNARFQAPPAKKPPPARRPRC
jgi:hypothetical protein